MATCKLRTQFVFAPIVRVNDEERIVEGYAFVNPSVKGDTYSVSRKAMEDATPEYLRWGAIRSMHQPLAAGTAESIVWDENGALLRAKIIDDQEWRKVQAGVYKGFSIGVRPELVRGNSVEKLTWVENSLVDRPKDPDAVFTVARAEGFDPGEEFECEVEEIEPAISRDAAGILVQRNGNVITLYQAGDEVRLLRDASNGSVSAGCCGTVTMDEGNTGVQVRWEPRPGVYNLQAFPRQDIERATVPADGIQSAPAGEPGAEPIQAGDCTITREGDLYVLNGPDGALIGKFATEAEARQRAAEVADAMKDGDGGKDDATDQHGKTLVLPTDRAEEPTIAEGEELDLVRSCSQVRFRDDGSPEPNGPWQVRRKATLAHDGETTIQGELIHEAETAEAAGAWIKAHTRAVTAATPSLPVRENLEGKTPKEERANDGDTDDEKHVCRACGAEYGRCTGTRSEAPKLLRCCDCGMEDGVYLPGPRSDGFTPPTFAEAIASQEGSTKASLAWNTLRNVLFDIAWQTDDDREAMARECIQQFADYIAPIIGQAGERRSELFAPFTRTENHTEAIPEQPTTEPVAGTPDPQIIARLETDNAALILRAETAETELARVQTAQEVATRDLATAKEQITRLEAMPVAQQPLRFAHAVTREFFANAKLDHDGETARITTRMNEITSLPPTSDLGEQTARAQEYQLLKMALAGRA